MLFLVSNLFKMLVSMESSIFLFTFHVIVRFPQSIQRLMPYVLGLEAQWQEAAQQQDMVCILLKVETQVSQTYARYIITLEN